MLLEYSDLFYFPDKKESIELKELAELIKKYDAIAIQSNYFFDTLDEVSETGKLTLSGLLNAVNYCFTQLRDLWENHRFMERTLEACRKCQISEAQFLEGIIKLHPKRKEFLDISRFLLMLFSFSVQAETIKALCHYFMTNNLIDEEQFSNIKLELISQGNRWLFWNIFKEYFKKQLPMCIKLFELCTLIEKEALISFVFDFFKENDVKKFIFEVIDLSKNDALLSFFMMKHAMPLVSLGDKDLVIKLLKNYKWAIQYLADDLIKDREFMLNILVNAPSIVSEFPKIWLNDKSFVLDFLEQWDGKYSVGIPVQLSKIHGNDSDVIFSIIKKAPFIVGAEKIVLEKHLNNENFVLKLLNLKMPAIVCKLLVRKPSYLQYVAEDPNKELYIREFIKADASALQSIPEKFKNDIEILKIAVTVSPHALQYVPENFKSDIEFVKFAMAAHPGALLYASESLIKNKELLSYFLWKDGELDSYLSTNSFTPTFFSNSGSRNNVISEEIYDAFLKFLSQKDSQELLEDIFNVSFDDFFQALEKEKHTGYQRYNKK